MKSNIENIKAKILKLAISGKLVEQNPEDESAEILYKKIQVEKEKIIEDKKIRRVNLDPIKENEIPFEIPNSWKWVKLGHISENIHYGYTASAVSENTGTKMLRITDIQNNSVNWEKVPFCKIEEKKVENYKLNKNDILIARTGGTIGKNFIIRKNMNEISVFASYLIRVIPVNNLNALYIKFFLESSLYWNQLREKSKGTGQPNVNATSLKNLMIPLPPLNEQKRIVKKIDELFLLIDRMVDIKDNTMNVINLLEEKILDIAIKGKLVEQNPKDESVEILYGKIQEEKEKLIKSKKIHRVNLDPIKENEIPFKIPDSWKWVKLEDIASSIPHKKYQIRKKDMIDSGTIPVVSQSQQLIEGYSNLDSKTLTVDDAVIIFGDHTRIIKYIDFNFIVGADGVKIIKPFNGILNEYFYYSMLYNASITENRGYSRHYKYFKEKLIALPPLNEQKRIVEKLDITLGYISYLRKELE